MHYFHIISVQAETAEEAESEAESALAQYGNGQVWDWYEIGGRWDGALGATGDTEETYVKGTNTLSYAESPELFVKTLGDIEASHSAQVKDILAKLNGEYVRSEDVASHVLGLPVTDKSSAALRMSKSNRKSHLALKKILALKTVPNGPLFKEEFGSAHAVLWNLRQLSDLLCGYYNSDSHFYDHCNYSTYTCYLRGRIEEGGTNEWLVVADLHN